MTEKVRSSNAANEVHIFVNADKRATVSFLGVPLFTKESVPLDEARVRAFIDTLHDKRALSRFCTRNGVIETMAAQAVRTGAAERFAKNIAPYTTSLFTAAAAAAATPKTTPNKSPANGKKKAMATAATRGRKKKPTAGGRANKTASKDLEEKKADAAAADETTEKSKPDEPEEGEVDDDDAAAADADNSKLEDKKEPTKAEYMLANDY